MHKQEERQKVQGMPCLYSSNIQLGPLKILLLATQRTRKNIKGLCTRIHNGTVKILTATLHINGLNKFTLAWDSEAEHWHLPYTSDHVKKWTGYLNS